MARVEFRESPRREANRRLRVPAEWLREWKALPEGERWRGGAECLICGKPIRDARAATHVHLLTTGELADNVEAVAEAEDQGFFPVGPECAKLLPRSFRFPPEHVFGEEVPK